MPNNQNADFMQTTYDTWLAAAEKTLNGKSIESLTKHSYDDIAVNAFYQKSIASNQIQLPQGTWQINQNINHPNPDESNLQIHQDLQQGVDALTLFSDQSLSALGYGVNINQVNLKKTFKDIYLDMISLRLEFGLNQYEQAEIVEQFYQNSDFFEKDADLSLGIDPIGKLAQYGGFLTSESVEKSKLQAALKKFKAKTILRVDGRIAHNAGASEAQELSYIISCALTYLEWAEQAGFDLHSIAQKIEICLSATQNQFITIAKTRAMRQLWAELMDGLDIKQCSANIFAETSFRMVTKRDPWVNILRMTVACFSAGIGGANKISALPLSAAIGLAPSFDRRIARHIHTILIEESHLVDVCDPSSGSAYIETLTQEITAKAWQLFQTIQKTGGIINNLISDNFQSGVRKIADKRHHNFAVRRESITGTSQFPNLAEQDYECVDIAPQKIDLPDFKISSTPLLPLRDAEAFEKLRDKSDYILNKTKSRPIIFVAKLGINKDYIARSTFAKGFFETGGIEAIEGNGGMDIAAIVQEFKQTTAKFIVIASSDGFYKLHAAQLATALKTAGAIHIYLAGKPRGDDLAQYSDNGIDAFITAKSNLVKTINDLYVMIENGAA